MPSQQHAFEDGVDYQPHEDEDVLPYEYTTNSPSDGDMGEEDTAHDGLPMSETDFETHIASVKHRNRGAASKNPLRSLVHPTKIEGGLKKKARKGSSQWSNEALELAIEGLDQGYKLSQVCAKYQIPRSSLRNHLVGRSRGRKMDPKTSYLGRLIAPHAVESTFTQLNRPCFLFWGA